VVGANLQLNDRLYSITLYFPAGVVLLFARYFFVFFEKKGMDCNAVAKGGMILTKEPPQLFYHLCRKYITNKIQT